MAFIVPDEIERYAEEHTTPPTPLLAELAEETRATLETPQMLTGPIEGRFLELLVYGMRRAACARARYLQRLLGAFDGRRAAEGGHIDTCEVDPEHAEVARRYIARSPVRGPDHGARRPGARHDRTRWRASSTSSSSTPTR